MAWKQLTNADVLAEFSPAEVALLERIQGAQGELPRVLERVVSMVRGKIVAAGAELGPVGTLPDQVVTEAVDVARWRWLVSVPGLVKFATKERKELHDEGMKGIRRIESGEVKVEAPGSTDAAPLVDAPRPRITPRERHFN